MQQLPIELKIYQNSEFLYLKNKIAKFTKRAYFVGGFVRDCFLGIDSDDIDIEIYDLSLSQFEELMSEIGAKGVGKSFFVYRYKNFDLSLPRSESKVSKGHRGFDVWLCNDEKSASRRRDFTINAIMIDIFNKNILDFYGGILDIKNRILRVVDEKSFVEDSLRVLRAVQFASRFNLQVENIALLRSISLEDLSKERIKTELLKLFGATYQGHGLMLLFRLGIIEFLFGINLDEKKSSYIAKFIDDARKFIKDERLFLYIFVNTLKLDMEAFLKKLGLSKRYKSLLSEPFFQKATDFDLVKTALQKPLKEWLGCYSDERVLRAKTLGVYESKFKSRIKSASVINEGFVKDEIAKELERRVDREIENYLKELKNG